MKLFHGRMYPVWLAVNRAFLVETFAALRVAGTFQ